MFASLKRRSAHPGAPVLTVRQPRPRTYVRPAVLLALRLFFRFSASRDAYVLRIVGRRVGPVLRVQPRRGRRRPSVITP